VTPARQAPPPYSRQTIRFNKSLTAIGFALGGRAGERLASDLYLFSAARTLLRRIYDEPLGKVERVGKVNRLKMIKRMMFGRAGFALLKARVLHESG
jgi:hypothetical protein